MIENSRILLGALFACAFLTGCDKILWGEETNYAPRFSQAKFRKITEGLSEAEVISRLGAPLSRSTQEWSEAWTYSPPGGEPGGKGGNPSSFNLFGEFTRLEFDKSGSVTNFRGSYLPEPVIGLSKEEVRQKHGSPGWRILREFAVIFHYTEPGETGTYKRREVHFGEDGKVIRTESAIYYD